MSTVQYCDLCGVPLKNRNFYTLYIADCEDVENCQFDYSSYLKKVQKEVKDVCPTCKLIFDKIFELRMQNLNSLSNDLLGIYNLPQLKQIKNDKKRNNKK